MTGLTARKIQPHEADLFLAMARAFHIEDGHALTEAGEAAIHEVAGGVALAPAFWLVEHGILVGFFVLSLGYSPEHGGTDGFIDDIYIEPA
ncbi:MAG: hypothetical protein POH28_03455, partial [Acidocella sp.]|nr:hypothetical protein [Acidocella sp.]